MQRRLSRIFSSSSSEEKRENKIEQENIFFHFSLLSLLY